MRIWWCWPRPGPGSWPSSRPGSWPTWSRSPTRSARIRFRPRADPRQLQPGSLGRVGDRRRVDLDRGHRRGCSWTWPGRSCAGCRRCTRPCWPGRSTRTRRRSSAIRCGCSPTSRPGPWSRRSCPRRRARPPASCVQAGPAGHHHRPGRGPQTLPGGGQTPAGVVRPGRGRHAQPGRAAPTRRPGRRRVRPPRRPGHRPARGRRQPRAGGTTRRCDARPAPRPHHQPATRPRHRRAADEPPAGRRRGRGATATPTTGWCRPPSRPPGARPRVGRHHARPAERRWRVGGVPARLPLGWWAGVDRAGDHPDGAGRTPRRARLVGAGHRRRGPRRGPRPGHARRGGSASPTMPAG